MSVAYIKTLQHELQKSKKTGEQLVTQNKALINKIQVHNISYIRLVNSLHQISHLM